MEPEERPVPLEPEAEQEHDRLLRRVEALLEISRKERERLEAEAPDGENLPSDL